MNTYTTLFNNGLTPLRYSVFTVRPVRLIQVKVTCLYHYSFLFFLNTWLGDSQHKALGLCYISGNRGAICFAGLHVRIQLEPNHVLLLDKN